MTEPALTVARLWKSLTLPQRVAAAHAFWSDEEIVDDQIQAVMAIAQQKKFRPKTVVALDVDRKARQLASLPNLAETLAARALIVFHLAERRPMMSAFLDALGVPHENGVIKDDAPAVDPARLAPAVAAISGQFERADVALYLRTLLCQDPDTWTGLGEVVKGLDA